MSSFNRVILVGNVTRDIDIRYLQSGTAVTDLGLAVNDRRKNGQGEFVEETTFVDITLWGRTAEVASEYLGKGSPVLVEGRLRFEQWEQDGVKRSKLKVVGERMQMLGRRGDGQSQSQNQGDGQSQSQNQGQNQGQNQSQNHQQQRRTPPRQEEQDAPFMENEPGGDIPF